MSRNYLRRLSAAASRLGEFSIHSIPGADAPGYEYSAASRLAAPEFENSEMVGGRHVCRPQSMTIAHRKPRPPNRGWASANSKLKTENSKLIRRLTSFHLWLPCPNCLIMFQCLISVSLPMRHIGRWTEWVKGLHKAFCHNELLSHLLGRQRIPSTGTSVSRHHDLCLISPLHCELPR